MRRGRRRRLRGLRRRAADPHRRPRRVHPAARRPARAAHRRGGGAAASAGAPSRPVERPTDGLRGAEIAGRPVEIVEGCTELNAYSLLIEEARRLVETERVDVIIGSDRGAGGDGVPPRGRALSRRDVRAGLVRAVGRDVRAIRCRTSSDSGRPAPRASPVSAPTPTASSDGAPRRSSPRTTPAGWEGAAGFTAEFCALGGRIVSRDLASLFAPAPAPADVRRARAADGVAIFSIVGFVASAQPGRRTWTAYARGRTDLSRRVRPRGLHLRDPGQPRLERSTRRASSSPEPSRSRRRPRGGPLRACSTTTFPGLPKSFAVTEGVGWYGEAAEAVVRRARARPAATCPTDRRRFRAGALLVAPRVGAGAGEARRQPAGGRHDLPRSRSSGPAGLQRSGPSGRSRRSTRRSAALLTAVPEQAPGAVRPPPAAALGALSQPAIVQVNRV